ncbi:MAG TPA: dephospho-CoA kinase [Thermoanaerobaculia bacterium]|nr:dephospho-CoA kinase [Thermoanaerobaculia bacterium]
MLRVGLTGGIASGKSTILRNFNALGCVTVDADAVVAKLYRPGNAGHAAIVRTYGSAVLREDGEIDRKKLADVAFANAAEAQKLNALIHPLVIAEEERVMGEHGDDDAIHIVEATLLLEAGGKQRYDRIVVVDVDPDVQLERAVGRGMTRQEAARRIAHQMPRAERLRQADYVIDNSGDARAGEKETRRVYELLRRDLEAKKRGELAPAPSNYD